MHRRELMKYTLAAAPAALLGRVSVAHSAEAKDTGAVPDARLTAPLTVPASGEIRVAVLVGPAAEVIDYAGPWAVFDAVATGTDHLRRPFKLYTVAASKDAVKTSGGMVVLPDHTFADAPTPNVVVVPAMDIDKLAPAAFAAMLDWLRSTQKNADVTMSVCNGSFILARAGMLDGKKAASHHGASSMMRSMFPKVTVIRGVRYIEDGKIASSGGLSSGLDLAMRVIERYYGRDIAKQTARTLEYQGTGWMYPNSNAEFASAPVGTAERPICPVCKMQIDAKTALTSQYEGKLYHFCSNDCKQHFVANPKVFIDAW